jgi:hypothetical protein
VSEPNAADADPETDAWTPPPPDSPAAASEDGSVEDAAEKGAEGAEEDARASSTGAEHAEAPTTPNAAEGDSVNKGIPRRVRVDGRGRRTGQGGSTGDGDVAALQAVRADAGERRRERQLVARG